MPLLRRRNRPPTPPRVVQPGVEIGRARATYVDPTGREWPLDEPERGWFTLDEVSGLAGTPPKELISDPLPRGGHAPRSWFPVPRTIVWPLHIGAVTHMEFTTLWRQLARAFELPSLTGRPGWLRIAQPDGRVREIGVYCQAGFDDSPGKGLTADDPVLALWCPDPYWRSVEVSRVVREFTAGTSYLSPYPTVSSGRVLGETVITTLGDVETWPDWQIRGPAGTTVARNHTLGREFYVDPDWDDGGPLTGGQTVTIASDPPTVLGPSGQTWTGAVFPGEGLWPLAAGRNEVEFSVSGSNVGTRIELSWRERYLTP